MIRKSLPLAVAGLSLLAACNKPAMVAARPMGDMGGVQAGDCVEARRRAAAKPDLPVDRLPAPIAQTPRPFQRMPASVKRQVDARGASVKVDVVIDTLGRPMMNTLKVVESKPDKWMGNNVRSIIPRWKFSPAELAGCKVPRVYKFSATAPKRG
jgi:hypothetical protein